MAPDLPGSTPAQPASTEATADTTDPHNLKRFDFAPLIPGGATREARPTDYSQLSHVAIRLMAETQHEGNEKYGYGNWQRGLQVSNLLSHAMEHILRLQNGDCGPGAENHLGHALWNLEKAAHFIETRPDLIDIIPMRVAMGLPPLQLASSMAMASLAASQRNLPPLPQPSQPPVAQCGEMFHKAPIFGPGVKLYTCIMPAGHDPATMPHSDGGANAEDDGA